MAYNIWYSFQFCECLTWYSFFYRTELFTKSKHRKQRWTKKWIKKSASDSSNDITSKNFYYLPLIFVTSGLFNLFGTMTNEMMTPLHVGIGDTIAALLFIFMREEDIHLVTLILQLLLIVIIIISCFALKLLFVTA